MGHPLLSKAYIDGVYIPMGLLVVGIAIIKPQWLPYAITVALGLGSWKFYGMRKLIFAQGHMIHAADCCYRTEKGALNCRIQEVSVTREDCCVSQCRNVRSGRSE
jgi:hypothetical protein